MVLLSCVYQKQIAICYNNIGTNYTDLQDYDKAIFYNQKALKKFDGRVFKDSIVNIRTAA